MPSNDALITKTVEDARRASPNNDVALKHVLDEIHQIKINDQGDPSRLTRDYNVLSMKLHQEGILPGLTITDSASGSVTVTGSDGKAHALDAHSFGISVGLKCPPPVYDPAVGDQNPAKVAESQMRCERILVAKLASPK